MDKDIEMEKNIKSLFDKIDARTKVVVANREEWGRKQVLAKEFLVGLQRRADDNHICIKLSLRSAEQIMVKPSSLIEPRSLNLKSSKNKKLAECGDPISRISQNSVVFKEVKDIVEFVLKFFTDKTVKMKVEAAPPEPKED